MGRRVPNGSNPKEIALMSRLVSRRACLAAALVIGGLLPSTAHAKKDCGAFTVVLSDGRTFVGKQKVIIPGRTLPPGARALVQGAYARFEVDLVTFSVFDHGLTGAPAPTDITGGVPTRIFAARVPLH